MTDRLAKLSERYFVHPDEGGDLLSGVDLDELCGLQHEEIDRLKAIAAQTAQEAP